MNSLWEFTLQIPSTVEQKRELEHGKEVYIYYNDEKVFSGIVGQIRHDEPDVGIIQVGRYHVSWQLGWMIFATSFAWSPDYELYGLDPNKITYPGVSATRILDDIIDCALFKGINDYAREVCPTGIIAMQFGYEKCGYDPEHPPGAVARLASDMGFMDWMVDDDKRVYISGTLGSFKGDLNYRGIVSHEEDSLNLSNDVHGVFSYDGITQLATGVSDSASIDTYGERESILVDLRVDKMSTALKQVRSRLDDRKDPIHRIVAELPPAQFFEQALEVGDSVRFDGTKAENRRVEVSGIFRIMGIDYNSENCRLEISNEVKKVERRTRDRIRDLWEMHFAAQLYGNLARTMAPYMHDIVFTAGTGS